MARLAYAYGFANLENIEDAVQEALLKAMQLWGYTEMPDNPTAWLYSVAKNKLIDRLRKDQKNSGPSKLPATGQANIMADETIDLGNTISDSQLKMIFACCHPSLSIQNQIILSLKLIGGFSNRELADALLKKEEAIAKSFTRAKKQLKDRIKTLESPLGIGLRSRLFVVLRVIYLLFSEGYSASTGTQILKRDICYEAIRLALLLRENPYCRHPELEALLALMCFHTSRFDARLDREGQLQDLEHQDRNLYNRELIRIGRFHLGLAGNPSGQPSRYYLEAAVSYEHCKASRFSATRWRRILELYDLQLQKYDSPIVALNRIVAYQLVHGPKKAMQELKAYERRPDFRESALFYAISSEILNGRQQVPESIMALKAAIRLSTNHVEQAHLQKKLQALQQLAK